MAKLETLQDNFDDNSLDAGKWNNWGGAQVVETNQELEMTTTTAANYYGIASVSQYDLTDSYIFVRIVNPGNTSLSTHDCGLICVKTAGVDEVIFQIYANDIVASKRVSSIYTSMIYLTYNSTNHKLLRIRESGGTTYWDYSADGRTWTNLWSETNPIILTAVSVTLQVGNNAIEASGTTSKFDDLNIVKIVGESLLVNVNRRRRRIGIKGL